MQVTLTGEPTPEQKPRHRREEWLREQYVEQGKSTHEIADMVDCSTSTVYSHLNKYDIQTRSRYKQISGKLRSEEWLREQYVEQRKTMGEMANMADCDSSTVRRYLNKHGIETRIGGRQPPDKLRNEDWLREQYVEQSKSTVDIADMADCGQSTVRRHLNKHGIEMRSAYPSLPDRVKNEDWLREQYVEQGKSTVDIADMADCDNTTVGKYLNKYGIEIRDPSRQTSDELKREDWLREQYIEQGKSTHEIADMADSSPSTVGKYLNNHGIEIRSVNPSLPDRVKNKGWLREQYVEQGKTTVDIADMADCCPTTVRKYLNKHGIETRTGGTQTIGKLRREEWLREQYVEQGKTTVDIADMADCTGETVRRVLNNHGIERRSRGHLSGADHPQYAGGQRGYGPGWNECKRRAVRERDGNACRNCGMSQEQHRRQHDERLHVHHITKAREFDDADKRNAMSNLVALCRDCHHGHFERMADTGLQPQIPGVNYPNE